jgi:hypothetical protein
MSLDADLREFLAHQDVRGSPTGTPPNRTPP